jgi:hypothetical protein
MYVKSIFPERHEGIHNYFFSFLLGSYDIKVQFMFLPFFNRIKDKENDNTKKIAKLVRLFRAINICAIVAIVLFFFLVPWGKL